MIFYKQIKFLGLIYAFGLLTLSCENTSTLDPCDEIDYEIEIDVLGPPFSGVNNGIVRINIKNGDDDGLEYSLGNESFQSDNVFTGLSEGEYIIFLRDENGCQSNKQFVIDGVGGSYKFQITNPKSQTF